MGQGSSGFVFFNLSSDVVCGHSNTLVKRAIPLFLVITSAPYTRSFQRDTG